jgi:S-methylmethionine-dependent homocysteine/selenocysteine methylase
LRWRQLVRKTLAVAEALPQLAGGTFITDGGLETTLVFRHGLELPCFASFPLLDTEDGLELLRSYFDIYLALADTHGVGVVVDAPTWRASDDWGEQLGFSRAEIADINRRGVDFVEEVRSRAPEGVTVVTCGAIGPRRDAYQADTVMTAGEAEAYHSSQLRTLAETSIELVTAYTLTNVPEAVGIVAAAGGSGLPVAISFTVETDGRLPSGESLQEAIEEVDAASGATAAYFMINCAHPSHFRDELPVDQNVAGRIRGLRANASTRSHTELDESKTLDDGDPTALAADYRDLRARLPNLNVVGGCCGTDERHVAAICAAWVAGIAE